MLSQYAAYNLWANQRIVEVINNLSDEQTERHIESSFNGIQKTLLHLWDIEDIWWQRLKLTETQVWQSDNYTGSLMELTNNLPIPLPRMSSVTNKSSKYIRCPFQVL